DEGGNGWPIAREVESRTSTIVPRHFVMRSSDERRVKWSGYYTMGQARSYFSRATPTQTRTAAIQRRWSTSSLRKILAMIALATNVIEAEAGATRLSSPQESAVSKLKKPTEKQHSARRKRFSLNTLPTTASVPRPARSSLRSPIRFMALESRTSPPLEANTIMKMAAHSSSDFMLLLARAQTGFTRFGLGDLRTARHPADAAADQQDSQPTQWRDIFVEKVSSEESDEDVAQRGCRQDITQVGP